MNISKDRLSEAIKACIANPQRLLDDVEFLELNEPPSMAFFCSIIAQEELAKAFILSLVRRDLIPWEKAVLRAIKDHSCKQLLFIVMDYLYPDFEEFKKRCDEVVLYHRLSQFPQVVADALNILRFEKIGRWERRNWVWAEPPIYDAEALSISEGKLDRIKQDSLYVRLAADGPLNRTQTNSHGKSSRIKRRGRRGFVA